MKIKYLLSVVVALFLMASMAFAAGTKPGTIALTNGVGTTDAAHDTVWIAGGVANLGNFETVINGDTLTSGSKVGHGTRNNPNTVYVLAANTLYFEQAGLTVTDTTGTLTIIGLPSGGANQKPVLLFNEFNSTVVTSWQINANLKIINIQNSAQDLQNAYLSNGEGDIFISGTNRVVDIENCLFEFDNIALINAQSCTHGLSAYFRGNYFRDFWNGNQWWGGRTFYAKVAIDTFVYTNNTSTLTGLNCLQQNSLTQWAFIDHNTIIDNLKYTFLNPIYLTCYFTNNIIVNANMGGDDSINIIRGKGQDPDGLRCGIIGVDTINTRLVSAIQEKYKIYVSPKDTGKFSIDQTKCGLDNIAFYAAGNVMVADTNKVFANYWGGIKPVDGIGNHAKDSAASYLTWAISPAGPYGLINYPEVFVNSRVMAMSKTHKGIVISSVIPNSIYAMPTQALKFRTSCLDSSQVNYWIQYNRAQYGDSVRVGGKGTAPVTVPTYSKRMTFGDCDPTTIPGPGQTEVKYTSASGGITKFSDLKENFNQTVVTGSATTDGLPAGSLIWGTTAYNEKASFNFARYNWDKESGKGTGTSEVIADAAVTVTTYPNPFSASATISYTLPAASHVTLTVLDLSGKVVATLVNENQEGAQSVTFTPAGLSNGIYVYVLTTDKSVVTGKLLLQK
jgi:hypothetical protein